MKRLSKQIEELQETANVSQEAEECKDPELAFSECQGRNFSGIVNRDHVAEANFSSRNVGESLSRVVFGSLVVNSSSVHVERSKSYFREASPSAGFPHLRENPCVSAIAATQAAAFQASANSKRRISQGEIPCSRRN